MEVIFCKLERLSPILFVDIELQPFSQKSYVCKLNANTYGELLMKSSVIVTIFSLRDENMSFFIIYLFIILISKH